MGDRANMFFIDREADKSGFQGMYFYTHWAGESLPEIVQNGLKRGKSRWGDSQYLARILFCELIQEDVLGETGFGLSTIIGDNEHIVIRIDDMAMRVSFHQPGQETHPDDRGFVSWSYEEFVNASLDDLNEKYSQEAG